MLNGTVPLKAQTFEGLLKLILKAEFVSSLWTLEKQDEDLEKGQTDNGAFDVGK
jgi:hypothetical protein